ncbi:MAG: hypothetical protein MK074_00620 [Phycisphaerales bacterium]|nr:hypothetical protein [Phycisphaerales bacterium]
MITHRGLDRDITVGADAATRRHLGLPTDRPVIAAGHQPGLQHGGILAKDMAVAALAHRAGGVGVHLLLDTVDGLPATVDVPVHSEGRWAVEHRSRLDDKNDADCMQHQFDALGIAPTVIRSSSLLGTPGAVSLLDRMRADAAACTAALQHAVDAVPGSGVRRPADGELPMWVHADGGRRIATADDLHTPQALAPRAVLTTAIMRLFVCDLFVHGTGGSHYDKVTDLWLTTWRGQTPPPRAMVTADVYPDAAARSAAMTTLAEVHARHRAATHATTDPAAKQALLDRIDAAPRGSAERRDAFAALTALRQQRAPVDIDVQIEDIQQQLAVLDRRDYPLLALPESARRAFISACIEAFGPVT